MRPAPTPTPAQMQALLGISQTMATVQDRTDLLRVMSGQIRQALPYDDAGIAILNEAGDQYHEFLTAEALPSEVNQEFTVLGYDTRWLPVDAPIQKAFEARGAILYDVAEEARQHPDTLSFPVFQQAGIQQIMARSIQSRGRTLGEINLSSQRIDQYSEADFPVFNIIADLVAVAVANILATEEVLEREREKSHLLEISEAIAQVQNSKQLLRVIYEKIKPVFPYDNAGLYVFDQTGESLWELLDTDVLPDATQAQLVAAKLLGPHPYRGYHPGVWFYADTPAIYSLSAQEDLFPPDSSARATFKIGLANGLQQMIGGPLNCGGRKIGAFSFNTKQADLYTPKHLPLFQTIGDQIAVAVDNILAKEAIERQLQEIITLKKRIEAENVYLQEEVKSQYNFEAIIGNSPALYDCLAKVGMVANTPSTVLVEGETGTGKELIARAIHNLSERRAKPLIKINCAALPRELIESELFGHERGAFTGAIDKRIGKFELANGSTLFLDEVGELPLEVQAKLLRAIQEREVERLGSNRTITVDVRIIAATNRDLQREVQAGRFRADLYFRLNVFPISLPPLRERRDDIPMLAAHFVQKSAKKVGKVLNGISTKAMQALLRYHFPGNIRELEHIIERGAIMATGRIIQELHLPVLQPKTLLTESTGTGVQTLAEQERTYILSVLEHCQGRVSGPNGAARLLDLPPSTLESKMKKLDIAKKYRANTD